MFFFRISTIFKELQKRIVLIAIPVAFCLVSGNLSADPLRYKHQSLHDVYLANTEHELHVFRIYGREPGKTLMLIGGIQGDEPGGYLTADLYADITLKKGNLIVVPRANFYSILLNQRNGLTGDMNRKFGEKEQNERNMEQEIVDILKSLIGESDCLLNLHEGSGFYHPEWISDMENPNRFGQSIIFDAAQYTVEQTGQTIDLEDLSARVIARVNSQIQNPRYHFRANNHDTLSSTTLHPEQRKSATFYALTRAHIPAFGVETSKSIRSNTEKVHYHKLVVNSFMEELGIIPDTPGEHTEKPQVEYILLQVDGGIPYAVPNGSRIHVDRGAEVIVTDIIGNFQRGMAADFEGLGSYNDTRLPFRLAKDTKILIRKDSDTCGVVDVVITSPNLETNQPVGRGEKGKAASETQTKAEPPVDELRAEKLLINRDGEIVTLGIGEELPVQRNKVLILKSIQSNISRLDPEIKVNLKGFAPPKSRNDGNDLNFPIYPGQLWKRFSENRKGIRYPIEVTHGETVIGEFWIRLTD